MKATTAYQRPDLAARARQALQRLHDPRVRVLVIGEFKQGKSQLVNALVQGPDLPGRRRHRDLGADRRSGTRESPSATLVRASRGPGRRGRRAEERTPVPVEELAELRVRGGQPRQPRGPEVRRGRAARGACWPAAWNWSTRPGSAAWARCTARPPWPCCPARTPCCWSPTPPQEYTARSWSSAQAAAAVPQRGLRADQDRPVPAVARINELDPATWPRPGSTPRSSRSPRCCGCTRSQAEDQRAQRGVRVPGPGHVPARPRRRAGRAAGPPVRGQRRAARGRAARPRACGGAGRRRGPRSRRAAHGRAGPGQGSGPPRCATAARWQQCSTTASPT